MNFLKTLISRNKLKPFETVKLRLSSSIILVEFENSKNKFTNILNVNKAEFINCNIEYIKLIATPKVTEYMAKKRIVYFEIIVKSYRSLGSAF